MKREAEGKEGSIIGYFRPRDMLTNGKTTRRRRGSRVAAYVIIFMVSLFRYRHVPEHFVSIQPRNVCILYEHVCKQMCDKNKVGFGTSRLIHWPTYLLFMLEE